MHFHVAVVKPFKSWIIKVLSWFKDVLISFIVRLQDLAKMALWILQQDDRLSGIESGKEPNDGSFKM